jgi:hypothetical protein
MTVPTSNWNSFLRVTSFRRREAVIEKRNKRDRNLYLSERAMGIREFFHFETNERCLDR